MVRAEIWSCCDFSHQNVYDDKVLVPWPNSFCKLAHILYMGATQCQQHVSAESQVYISCTYVCNIQVRLTIFAASSVVTGSNILQFFYIVLYL